jgi:hypothetical protein
MARITTRGKDRIAPRGAPCRPVFWPGAGWGSGDQALADHEASGSARAEPLPARSLGSLKVDRWTARSGGSAGVSAGGRLAEGRGAGEPSS